MKKLKMFISRIRELENWAALLMAGAAMMFTACSSSSDDSIIEQPAEPTMPKICTLTVNATKGEAKGGDATTRALGYDSGTKTLNATWTTGDKVAVYYMHPRDMGGGEITYTATQIGTLEAQSSGASTTLTGEVTTTGITIGGPTYGVGSSETHDLTTDDKLMLSYSGTLGEGLQAFSQQQDGTLQTLADYFDYAGADVTVSSVSGSMVTISEEAAEFENLSYIIRFTLKDNAGNAISPTNLSIKCQTTGEYPVVGTANINITTTTYETNGAGVVFVQLPRTNQTTGFTGDITLTATVGNETYVYTRLGVTFENSKFYDIKIKMLKENDMINLSTVTASSLTNATLTLNNGDVVTGSLVRNGDEDADHMVKVTIADGATVTLYNATIDGKAQNDTNTPWAGITCEGDANIILSGANTVTNFHNDYPAIFVPSGKTLTIGGTGSLTASNTFYDIAGSGAAIGGGKGRDCGNIEITGGTITAKGGYDSAAIGGGLDASCGSITISGGNVKATADAEYGGAGIGSGMYEASCGNILITGGTVTAMGGGNAAGIGSADRASCGNISISGACTVIATGGESGAGIGTGKDATCVNITISGGTVTATGGESAAGIGCGISGKCGAITIKDEGDFISVTAIKGGYALYPIGPSSENLDNNSCGTIKFGNYKVYTEGNDYDSYIPSGGGLNFSGDIDSNTWVLTN